MTARAEARTVVCAEAVLQWVLRVARVTEAGMRVAIWMVERAAVAAPEERVVRARSTRCSRRRPRTHCTWCATDCCWPSTRCHTGEAKALAEARAARAMRAARVAPQAVQGAGWVMGGSVGPMATVNRVAVATEGAVTAVAAGVAMGGAARVVGLREVVMWAMAMPVAVIKVTASRAWVVLAEAALMGAAERAGVMQVVGVPTDSVVEQPVAAAVTMVGLSAAVSSAAGQGQEAQPVEVQVATRALVDQAVLLVQGGGR